MENIIMKKIIAAGELSKLISLYETSYGGSGFFDYLDLKSIYLLMGLNKSMPKILIDLKPRKIILN